MDELILVKEDITNGQTKTVILAGPYADHITIRHQNAYIIRKDAANFDIKCCIEKLCDRIRLWVNSDDHTRCHKCREDI